MNFTVFLIKFLLNDFPGLVNEVFIKISLYYSLLIINFQFFLMIIFCDQKNKKKFFFLLKIIFLFT
jgi:hypothetical protein